MHTVLLAFVFANSVQSGNNIAVSNLQCTRKLNPSNHNRAYLG